MFWLQRNQGNSIEKLLENPETTLNQVLKDSSFASSSRSPSKTLINFLISENNLNQIITLALTNDLKIAFDDSENDETENEADIEKRKKEFNKIQRSAVLALTSQSKIFQAELLRSEQLKERLCNFPNSDYSSDPKICGHYSRIIESILRASNGKYLYQLPNILDFLISKINVLPCRELFIIIFCEFTAHFIKSNSGIESSLNTDSNQKAESNSRSNFDSLDEDDDDDENSEDSESIFHNLTTKEEREAFMRKLLYTDQLRSGESTFFIFSAINIIFSQSSDLICYFATPECFKQILEIAILPEQKQIGSIEAFKVAYKIMIWPTQNAKKSVITIDQVNSIIDEIEPKFNLAARPNIDGVTAFAAEIFTKSAAQLITKLFDDDSNTFLNYAIVKAFKKLPYCDQLQIVKEKDLTHKIILSFIEINKEDEIKGQSNVINDNGQITELAQILNIEFNSQKNSGSNNEDIKCFETEEWRDFINNVLTPHIQRRDTFDNVKSSSDSSDFDEEVEDEDEIEEEEEEEADDEILDKSDDEGEGGNEDKEENETETTNDGNTDHEPKAENL